MKRAFIKYPVLGVIFAYTASFFLSLPFNNSIFRKYFIEPSRAFDANFYLNIAERGYQDPNETAFYPLWPLLLSIFEKIIPQSLFVQAANLTSVGLFFLSLVTLWFLCERLTNRFVAHWTVLLFALNPNSVFHALAYPESLFSLLACLFVWFTLDFLTNPGLKPALQLFFVTILMASTRPILMQILAAGWTTLGVVIFVFRGRRSLEELLRRGSQWLAITTVGCLSAYIPYGLYCLRKFDNFFQPFAAQRAWDRKFGIYWSLITQPKSVSGSDNILVWDLQAFYLPTILAGLFIASQWRESVAEPTSTRATAEPWRSFTVILVLMIAAAHSAIAFLTYPIFMSLARHVFATPFFFIGAGAVIQDVIPKKYRLKVLGFYAFASMVYLLNFWTRFGKSAWMG